MAYRVGRREDLARGLLRLLREDLDGAAQDLRGSGRRDERIHQVRQRLKRIRTILRVLEPAFGQRAVAARRALSEAARLLARARDADVAAASAHALAASVAAHDDPGFDRIADTLDREAERAHAERTPIGEVTMRLASAGAHAASFKPDFDGAKLLRSALRKTYAKGRAAMRRAETSLATPDLHQWRKQVKQLWYLLRLTRKRLPGSTKTQARRLEKLGNLLGLDHDHAMLAEKLALSPTADLSLMSQLGVISKRRQALEAKAFDRGARLYAKKPKAFARRLKLR